VALSAVLGVAGGVVGGQLLGGTPRGPDPLGLGVPLVNQACNGQSLLVTASGTSDAGLSSAVAEDPDHTRYLRIDSSCGTAWRQNDLVATGYVTYLGPYASAGQACQQRMTVAHRGDLVTRLSAGSTEPLQCLCYLDYATFPILRPRMTITAQIGIYVRAMQKLLVTAKLNPPDHVNGLYDEETTAQIKAFQGQVGLPQNGVLDSPTWHQLLSKACGD
jgi:peptidoglycan hydrolase-like protein with peptidoglycan-binding domain